MNSAKVVVTAFALSLITAASAYAACCCKDGCDMPCCDKEKAASAASHSDHQD